MAYVSFFSYPLRDEIFQILQEDYLQGEIPRLEISGSRTVRVEGDQPTCEGAWRRVRAKFGNRVEVWASWLDD